MKKRRLLSLLLALALLAGCAPAAESPAPDALPSATAAPTATPAPEPEPTPTPKPVDFREFLDNVNAARKALAAPEEPIELPAEYTPDFYEQNHTFTEEEMKRLTTEHGPEENLTRDDLIADAETFFTLLRTTYGAYHYFGGDETFLPILEAVKEDLSTAKKPTADTLAQILYQHLAPVLKDGHFSIGDYAPRDSFALYMYYVPNLYLDSLEGLENPGYVKPTIGPDGRICWWYAALSHDGSDLPDTLDGHALKWQRALSSRNSSEAPAFSESEWEGVPVLISRRMSAKGENSDVNEQALQQLEDCGKEYAGSPLLIFDVRGNGGGSDRYIRNWFLDWAGLDVSPDRCTVSYRYSQLSCHLFGYSAKGMGAYHTYPRAGEWVERSGPVFVLQDKGAASSGESVVGLFRTAADTLFVGGPTSGMYLTPGNHYFYLPHTGMSCYFGIGLSLSETDENRDGVGFLPDLWVDPTKALDAVEKLIEYYGLNTEQ